MILQSLNDYYERERQREGSDIAPPGWVRRPLDYEIVLDADGRCVQIITAYQVIKARKVGRSVLLPAIGKQAMKHTNSGNDANLLWDTAGFVFGRGKNGARKLESFILTINTWFESCDDRGVRAVLGFLRETQREPSGIDAMLKRAGIGEDFEERDPIVAFRLRDDGPIPVHERPDVVAAYSHRLKNANACGARGRCLVTGRVDVPLADNETVIKGVRDAQTAGANIVSLNARSFVSYGKTAKHAEGAPISDSVSSAYSTSLNHLLASARQRMQVGDTSTVFWADRPTRFDGEFTLADFFGDMDDPTRSTRAVQALYESIRAGALPSGEGDTEFFVLGLAPNQGRISVRFWLHATLTDLAPRIAQHFRDLALVRQLDGDPATPSLSHLLRALAVQGKSENVPPRLAGEWMRAILEGVPYPISLLNAVVLRCRAEQATSDRSGNVTYLRAAMLKAWLNRDHRRRHADLPTHHAEFKEALDVNQNDVPYRLGRLFAVLERIQQQAQGSLNAGIRDRYYGAASTTPATVFPTLLRLKNAHLKKLGDAAETQFERLVGEIFGSLETPALTDFPTQLSLAEQGRVALGYYHQRQSFFTRKPDVVDTKPQED